MDFHELNELLGNIHPSIKTLVVAVIALAGRSIWFRVWNYTETKKIVDNKEVLSEEILKMLGNSSLWETFTGHFPDYKKDLGWEYIINKKSGLVAGFNYNLYKFCLYSFGKECLITNLISNKFFKKYNKIIREIIEKIKEENDQIKANSLLETFKSQSPSKPIESKEFKVGDHVTTVLEGRPVYKIVKIIEELENKKFFCIKPSLEPYGNNISTYEDKLFHKNFNKVS